MSRPSPIVLVLVVLPGLALPIAAPAAPPDAGAPDAAPAEPEAPPPPPTPQDLVTAWVAAQNRGDVAAYEALYANRFVAVRRAGVRTRRVDRKAYLAERQKLLARKVEVAAEAVVVTGGGPGSTLCQVGFAQRLASGGVRDDGAKRLELVREQGGWRIAREELESTQISLAAPAKGKAAAAPAPPAAAPAAPAPAPAPATAPPAHGATPATAAAPWDFGFFFDGDMVIGHGDAAWAKASFTHKGFDGEYVELRSKADDKLLPAAITRLVTDGARLVRFGGSCVGRLRTPQLRGRVVPHPSSRQAWKDADERLESGWLPEAWAMGDQQLVSTLDGCPEGGIFVRHPSLPAVSPVAPEPHPAASLVAAARHAFTELPDHKALDLDFHSAGGKGHFAPSEVFVLHATTAAGPTTLLFVSARAGAGCGGFAGELTALFRAGGKDGGGRIDTLWAVPRALRPIAAFDLDGNALPELLIETDLGGEGDKRTAPLGRALCRDADCRAPAQKVATPSHECPC